MKLSRWWILAGVVALLAGAVELALWLRLPPPVPRLQKSTQITNNGLRKDNLVVSSDGSKLYFDQFDSEQSAVMQVTVEGGASKPVNMTVANPRVQDISKQGELLIFSGGSEIEDGALWAVSVDSGAAKRLGDVVGHDALWEPNGKLVFITGKDFNIADHSGANPRKLAAAQGPPFAIRFSPDGSRFRFTIGNPKIRATVWEARSDGTSLRPVLPVPGWKGSPAPCCGAWTSDGKYFAFLDAGDVWMLADQAGGYSEPVQLTSGPLKFHDLAPGRDGRRLFAVGAQPRAELDRYDAPSGRFVPFMGGISAGDVDFSRDGQWVAYVTYPDGSLWRSRIDGSERLRLTSPPLQVASARWSPDGSRIAFSSWKSGEPTRVMLISKDGGSPEVLSSDNTPEADPTWSSDGKILAFVRFTRPSHIVSLDVASHARTELDNSEGLWHPRWSPDGRFLMALTSDSSAVMVCDHPGQKWKRLVENAGTIGTPAWSQDGKYLYFDINVNTPQNSSFLRVRVSDGKVEPVADLKNVRRYFGTWGYWSGLAPGDIPLLARDTSSHDLYALDW